MLVWYLAYVSACKGASMSQEQEPAKEKNVAGFGIDPALFNTPLNKLSGMFQSLVVKPAANAVAGAAKKVADAAGTVAKSAATTPAKPAEVSQAPAQTAQSQAALESAPTSEAVVPGLPRDMHSGPDVLVRRPPLGATAPLRGTPSNNLRKPGESGPLPGVPSDPQELEAWMTKEATQSEKRMAFIVQFLKNPDSNPDFSNKPLVYRIVTLERSYQQVLIAHLQKQLNTAQSTESDRLKSEIEKSEQRQKQLFAVLKKLTGRLGRTGGTGYLGTTPLPSPSGQQDGPNPSEPQPL